MAKKAAESFYLNVILWSLFCLMLGLIAGEVKGVLINADIIENESSAAEIIQSISICQASYSGKNRGKFANFAELVKSGCLEGDKISGEQPVINGYIFTLRVEEASATKPAFFSLNADPEDCENRCRRFYYDSTLKVIKFTEENRPANAADPSI